MNNRDRFYEKIKPIFESSKYEISKPTEGKYKDKKIEIINKDSGEHDFHIWCHIRNDRLDLLVPDFRIKQIPEELGLQTKCKNTHVGDRLSGWDATSFQELDEDALVEILKFIANKLI